VPGREKQVHLVKTGETLWEIATRYGVEVASDPLLEWTLEFAENLSGSEAEYLDTGRDCARSNTLPKKETTVPVKIPAEQSSDKEWSSIL